MSAATTRKGILAGGNWIVDQVKMVVPVWKKEFYADGTMEHTKQCSGCSKPHGRKTKSQGDNGHHHHHDHSHDHSHSQKGTVGEWKHNAEWNHGALTATATATKAEK